MEPKTSKRIVSKGRYVGAHIKKMWIYFDALSLLLFMPMLSYNTLSHGHLSPCWFIFLMAGITVLSVLNFMKMAISRCRTAKALDTGILLTRANVAHLPAPESLVRASREPEQAQQAVLLRAAAEAGQERQEEQLVRASVIGQE